MKTYAILTLAACVAWVTGCVRLSGPQWTYTRLGSVKTGELAASIATNGTVTLKLKGYTSDGEALAAGIAEGVARGLK